jgi:hypothetical protein
MTITQTIEVPASRCITLEVPPEIPAGKTIITFTPASAEDADSADENTDLAGECPICAAHHDPVTGNPRYNAETVAAIEEGDAMLRGEIPAKWYNSLEEMLVDLDSDD